ncbi:hypothetical protein EI546_14860 [Aequorivita sp. H23M31]|uniref:Glycosyltransferase RgtA/B/C/D-like domain-containing protein n=1 Tax=Aequorivita ciconiae TaxID=2494375 RepID=A0A410G6J7_9FLAO|nr:hypothetical protein [Aequorivita sp. H23M31]QAA82918.1 hypothetical protein EI546_14860 [Aequorivita sp. H23M31]
MKIKIKKPLALLLLSILIVLFSLNIGMFWDNVLFASKMGNPLFENGILRWDLLPLDSDPGHPPFLATILAFGWTLFGKSLAVSHWMMLPFIFGLLWQIAFFVRFFVKEKSLQIWAFLLVVADPTLLSQLVLVNPEIIQLFFFFLALNGVLKNNLYLKIVGLAFLGIVSYRGMMLCFGIFLIDFLIHLFVNKRNIKSFFTKRNIIVYILAATPAIIYLSWRLLTKGWISSHPEENWGNAWHFETTYDFIKNLLRNALVLIHRFLDFGRIVPFLFIVFTVYIKRKSIRWKKIVPIIIIVFFSTIVIYTTSLLINNAMGHRYYIPSFLALALLSFLLLKHYKFKKLLYLGLLGSLLLGNFIIYPDNISQGWDASLAHIPYWNLREDAIDYMDANQIPIPKSASFFPNRTTIDDIDLNGDMRSFIEFTGEEEFVFYSNVYNISDEDLDALTREYQKLKSFEKFNVRIDIMHKKKVNNHEFEN